MTIMYMYTVNQPLSAKTLLWNLRKMNWITATIIHNENVDYLDIIYQRHLITGSRQKIFVMIRL